MIIIKPFPILRRIVSNKIFYRVIGLLLLGFILYHVNLKKVLNAISTAALGPVVIGLLLTAPIVFVRSVRWNFILQSLDINVTFSDSFLYQMIAQMSFFTPGKVGELIKAFYLKARNLSLKKGGFSVIGDRLFDLISVASISGVSFFYFFKLPSSTILFSIMILIASIVPMIRFRDSLMTWGQNFLQYFAPDYLGVEIEKFFDIMNETLNNGSPVKILLYFSLSILAFLIQALRIWFFSLALGMQTTYLPTAGIVALMSLTNLLPISFLGLGTRDAVFVYFFGQLGVTSELSIALSLIILGNILLNSGLGGILFIIYPPEVTLDQLSREANKNS